MSLEPSPDTNPAPWWPMEEPARLNSATRRKRREKVKAPVLGFKAVNKCVCRAIGKVLTKARARDRSRDWGADNRDRQNQTVKRWKDNHRDEHLASCRRYNQAHAQKALDYQKQRRLTDAAFAIKCRMRARLTDCLKKSKSSKADHAMDLVACSPEELVNHLRKQCHAFDMAVHHVDHIFPFDLYDLEFEEHQRRVMHWSNTQPLTQQENSFKSNRLPTKAMAAKVHPSCWPEGVTMDDLPECYDGWATPLRMFNTNSHGAGSSSD